MFSGDLYGDGNDKRFKVANVFKVSSYEDYGKYQWLLPQGQPGDFILNLGCVDSYSSVELVNLYGYSWSTQGFKVFLR